LLKKVSQRQTLAREIVIELLGGEAGFVEGVAAASGLKLWIF
jgi:hypothetical protein